MNMVIYLTGGEVRQAIAEYIERGKHGFKVDPTQVSVEDRTVSVVVELDAPKVVTPPVSHRPPTRTGPRGMYGGDSLPGTMCDGG